MNKTEDIRAGLVEIGQGVAALGRVLDRAVYAALPEDAGSELIPDDEGAPRGAYFRADGYEAADRFALGQGLYTFRMHALRVFDDTSGQDLILAGIAFKVALDAAFKASTRTFPVAGTALVNFTSELLDGLVYADIWAMNLLTVTISVDYDTPQ